MKQNTPGSSYPTSYPSIFWGINIEPVHDRAITFVN